jgi:hypothetical protein
MGTATMHDEVIIKKGRETSSLNSPKLAEIIMAAQRLNIEMKALEPALKEYKEQIALAARDYIDASGTLTFIVDGVYCRVTFGYECVILEEKVSEVRRILGNRFEDLVKVKTVYNGTTKLIDMAADGDSGKALAACLTVKEKTPSIRFDEAA